MTDCHKQLLELLSRSCAKLHTLLTRLTLREDVAEDLMQELFIKLSDVATFKKISNLDSYAYRTAVNLAFDWRRSNKSRQIEVPLNVVAEPVSNDCSPLNALMRNEMVQKILSAVGRLNGTAREAFVMRYIQQESYEFVADQLDKTPHQVRALCYKVMNYLRDVLGSAGKEMHDV